MLHLYALTPKIAHLVHFVFEWLAILSGVQTYRYIKRQQGTTQFLQSNLFPVIIGCIIGAGIGNKAIFLLEMPQLWHSHGWQALMGGQTIVGGLVGGLLGVEISKKIFNIKQSTGDDFVLPLIVGTLVGRVGCLLAGLNDGTFGNSTALPWGVDFGDGIARHPTQVYDMLAVLTIGVALWLNRTRLCIVSGLSFKFYFASYLLWRLWVDGLKPVPYAYWLDLSGIQWCCIVTLLVYFPLLLKDVYALKQQSHFHNKGI